MLEHEHLRPGSTCRASEAEPFESLEAAVEAAEARVVSRGGMLGSTAAAMAGSRVSKVEARTMFTGGEGLARFVHVPIVRERR